MIDIVSHVIGDIGVMAYFKLIKSKSISPMSPYLLSGVYSVAAHSIAMISYDPQSDL